MDQRKKGFKNSPFKKGTTRHINNNYNKITLKILYP